MEKIRVGIFDDQAFFIKGLADFLCQQDAITIVFTTTSRQELEEHLAAGLPDVLMLDVLAPDVTGLELFSGLIKKHPSLKILAYTSLRSSILVENLLNLGVKGYVNKNQEPADLTEAIKEVHYDLVAVPDEYRHLIPRSPRAIKYVFTGRELDILQLLAQGQTSVQMAGQLGVSVRTIENLKVALFDKTGVQNAAELILAATRLGYLS